MRRLALLASMLGAAPAGAEPAAVTNEALRQLAAGSTVHLESAFGTLPVSFKEDGTMSAKASVGLALYLGSTTDRGRWTVQGDRICQKFFKWFAGETHCMRVKQDGRQIMWRRDDGLSGTATIAANGLDPPVRPAGLGVRPPEMAKAQTQPEAPAASPDAAIEREDGSALAPRRAANPAWPAVVTEKEREPALNVPSKPVLASLYGFPRGLFGSNGKVSGPSVPSAAPVEPAMPRIARGDLVEGVLEAQVSHMWCRRALQMHGAQPTVTTAGYDKPFIFTAVVELTPGTDTSEPDAEGTGCLMPSAALAEMAMRLAPGGR